MPRALYFFRWGALFTLVTGATLEYKEPRVALKAPVAVPARPLAGTRNTVKFKAVQTQKVRAVFQHGRGKPTALVEMAVSAGVQLKSLSVQNTTLDDVFVHYTGRQLRDEAVKAYKFVIPPRPGMQP